jgi:tRNA G18 (ribose-2'-O)-methylase SpoU
MSASPWGWKALRASMGSAFHVPVIRSRALATVIGDWRRDGVRIVATVPRGGTSMYDIDFTHPTAVLLGSEGAGLSGDLLETSDTRVSIPMHGNIESLNAAVAAAVLFYEAQRQRGVAKSGHHGSSRFK